MTSQIVMGCTFEPMDEHDYHEFAGAEPDSLICENGTSVLILCPDGTIHEIREDGSEFMWTCSQVNKPAKG